MVAVNSITMDLLDENVSSRLPPEIWVKIFTLVKSESINLSKLRPVCRQWQSVIDENFVMKVKINDDIMDVYSIYHFKRVTQCIVSKFIREDTFPLLSSPIQLFWDPKILSSLIIRGTISRPNFLVLAQQCQNVKQLFLTGYLLIGDTKLFEAESTEETNVLSRFMDGLEKLVVNGLHIGSSEIKPTPVNLFSVLNWPMPELKSLVARISYPDAENDKKFFQLLENCRSLESIEFTLRSYHIPLEFAPFVLPNLTTLNFEVRIQDRLVDWLPFISAQNTIKNLKIVVGHDEGFEVNLPMVEAILKNANTLESLEMRKISKVCHRVGAQFFTGMIKLKNLTLQGVQQPRIYNLHLVTQTMETLVLENFEVKKQEFGLISNRVVNLRTRNLNIS